MVRLTHSQYKIGWISALPLELAAARFVLDEEHEALLGSDNDHNQYRFGRVGRHNVVLACLPSTRTGTTSAASVATDMIRTFPFIKIAMMVGIGGGIPRPAYDIRLGDVVISKPTGEHGGVVQHDFGKVLQGGGFEPSQWLNRPPPVILSALGIMESEQIMARLDLRDFMPSSSQLPQSFHRPENEPDRLFVADYDHGQNRLSCDMCDQSKLVARPGRGCDELPIQVYFGTVLSGNRLMKDALERDRLGAHYDGVCFEMEASGLWEQWPCVVVRGICDYADSHKKKGWQKYAALTAAAGAKAFLSMVNPTADNANVSITQNNLCFGLNLFNAPELEEKHFVGRELDMQKMEELLLTGSKSPERRVVILGGVGGIGKTQLAIAYAKRHRSSYSSIFWLNATSEMTLMGSLRSLAQRIFQAGDERQREDDQISVSRWLSEQGNNRWLLIFDNYDEPHQYHIKNFYPYASHGSIIVTTRLPEELDGEKIRVQHLPSGDESLRILETRSGRHDVQSDLGARQLAKRLDGLPLALATAGAFLKRSVVSFNDYLLEYEARWNIAPERPMRLSDYPNRTLYTTWDLSFTQIKHNDPDAAKLLTFLAYLDNQSIWYELLHAGAGASSELPVWFSHLCTEQFAFEGAMLTLVDSCFIEAHSDTGSYNMHACVHDWTLDGLNRDVDAVQYWLAFDCVAYSINRSDWNHLSRLGYRRLTAHATRLVHNRFALVPFLAKSMQKRLNEMGLVAKLLYKQDQHKAAEQMYQRVLDTSEKTLGPDHTSTLETVNNLGVLYRDQGKLDKAEQMYQRALAGREKALGPDDTSTLETVNNLGILYWNQGKLDKAEQMYQRALAGKEKALGPDHTSTLNTVNNLGILYWNQGKLDKAEQMYQRALAGREKALGPDHTSTLETVNNLCVLYRNQGKLDKAEQMYQRALAGKEKALGPDHTSTLDTVNNLGVLYRNQGKLDKAEQMYQRALAGKEKALGPDHTSTLDTVNNLGVLYRDQGKLDKAEQMYQRALAGREKALGPDHTSTLDTVNNLGILYRDQGKLDKAEQMYQRALAGKEKALGPDHTSTLNTVNNLGILYWNQGKLDKAEQMYQRALAGREKALGPDHTSTLETVNNLCVLYRNQGKLDKAEQMYQRALAGKEKAFGPDQIWSIRLLPLLAMEGYLKRSF